MEIKIDNLHHAYLVLGNSMDTDAFISKLFGNLKINPQGNPDIIWWTDKKFGIDEARILKGRSETKTFGDKKIFIVNSPQITTEAQNALLKVFEEPAPNTHFFILSAKNTLLPTLLSRLEVINLFSDIKRGDDVKEFMANSTAGRLLLAKRQAENENFNLPEFLDELIQIIKSSPNNIQAVKKVFAISKFSNDPAVNKRMILEHLALTLPNSIE